VWDNEPQMHAPGGLGVVGSNPAAPTISGKKTTILQQERDSIAVPGEPWDSDDTAWLHRISMRTSR